jgi:hypothetical protein
MPKLFKLLSFSFLAVVICSAGAASGMSITEEFVFNYVDPSNTPFTITELSYELAGSNDNLLTGLQPYVTTPIVLSGSGQLSELISIDPTKNYVTTVGVNPAIAQYTATVSAVSPVPLPAGFPLFALALACLIGLSFEAARRKATSFCAGEATP